VSERPQPRSGGAAAAKHRARKKSKTCPICRQPQAEAHLPFCSKACADLDLSRWLGGRYAIPGALGGKEADEDKDEDAGAG
jgi:uncharacterized protein